MMPRMFQPDPAETIFYALGDGGNGVMYSAQAGSEWRNRFAGKKDKAKLDICIRSAR